MFCGNCGTENTNDAVYCKACGALLGNVVSGQGAAQPPRQPMWPGPQPGRQPAQPAGQQPAGQQPPVQPIFAGKVGAGAPAGGYAPAGGFTPPTNVAPRKLPVGLIAGIVGIVAAIIVLIAVVINMQNTINLNKYLEFEVTGYNGYGSVHATIDWDAIEDKYGDKISFTKAARQEYGGLLSLTTPTEVLQSDVYVDIDKNDRLSNGDTISYTWDIDSEVAEFLKCKLKYKDGTFDVADLKEVGKFDAFADLEVTFSGTAPNGRVSIDYNGSELSTGKFSYEPTDGLSNGDTVTVKLDESVANTCAQKYGKVPAEYTKDYTVTGLQSYLANLSELNADGLKALQSSAESEFNIGAWDDRDSDSVTVDSLTYLGAYLLTNKTPRPMSGTNALYLVYKVSATIDYTDDDGQTFNTTQDYYWYAYLLDVRVLEDGSLGTKATNWNTAYQSVHVKLGDNSWFFDGYETLDELHEDCVVDNADKFNCEESVSDS